MNRCVWCLDSEVMLQYHDEEWGKPLHDDRKHFEYLLMEVMQCGLNWNMMLKKRDIFKKCFDNYDYNKIANYDDFKIESIMNTDGMIKSKKKILAIVNNARAFLKIIDEFGSFDNYIWSFSNYRIMVYHKHQQGYEEVKNSLSDRLSCDLKKRGFKYLGSITIFSHLQTCGIINDHDCNCFRYQELLNENSAFIVYE